MSLDAVIYCNCFEASRLREPPPPGCRLGISKDGSLCCGSDDLNVQLAFDQWLHDRACEHQDGVLLHHYLGNIATIEALRTEIGQTLGEFPMILGKVLYNGTHCGDFVEPAEVALLRQEIGAMKEFSGGTAEIEQILQGFTAQLSELVECSLRIGKPIDF